MANSVLALLSDAGERGLSGADREALGFAHELAGKLALDLVVALHDAAAGPATTEAAERGALRVFPIVFGEDTPADVALLWGAATVARQENASVVIVSRGARALGLAPRLAARLGGGCVMNVAEVALADGLIEATAVIFGGAARAVYRLAGDGPAVLSPIAAVAEAPARGGGVAGSVQPLSPPQEAHGVRVVRPARAPEGPRLEDATVVVSGGRGLGDSENYGLIRELAAALGGMPGASRAIVDDGWARPAEQVGLTGKIVAPQLYIAAGISGASQHMAGCANATTLVAINSDRDAPIFRYAQLGIVDDCLAVLPELIRLAKARTGSR
jgi:electron transfer flavoprotein alpha subunit